MATVRLNGQRQLIKADRTVAVHRPEAGSRAGNEGHPLRTAAAILMLVLLLTGIIDGNQIGGMNATDAADIFKSAKVRERTKNKVCLEKGFSKLMCDTCVS